MSLVLIFYIALNLIIVVSYTLIAFYILRAHVGSRWSSQVYGALFFVTCGLTHIELVTHAWTGEPLGRAQMTDPYHMMVHVVQAVAVMAYASSFVRAARLITSPTVTEASSGA